MTTTSPCSRRSQPSRLSGAPAQSGSAQPILFLLIAIIFFAAGAAATWWWLTQRGATTTSAAPTPAPDFGPLTPSSLAGPAAPSAAPSSQVAEAAPPPEAAPATTRAGAAKVPPGRRAARPPVAPAVPPVAQLLTQAEGAVAARRFADAAELYDRALKIDPRNEAARAGKARIAAMGASRNFVLGTTVVESLRAVGRDLDGFDTSGVGVKRAPKVEGQIELVMEPARVNPGDPYAVKVFLKNEGKKPIDVDEMKVSMIVDGKWATRPMPPKVKRVAPRQRALLEELPGVWRAGVNDWAIEAVVTSKGQDVYRNRLTWK
jgi:hypothetical protein